MENLMENGKVILNRYQFHSVLVTRRSIPVFHVTLVAFGIRRLAQAAMNAHQGRMTKMAPVKHAQKARFRIKLGRQTVRHVLQGHNQEKEHTSVDLFVLLVDIPRMDLAHSVNFVPMEHTKTNHSGQVACLVHREPTRCILELRFVEGLPKSQNLSQETLLQSVWVGLWC